MCVYCHVCYSELWKNYTGEKNVHGNLCCLFAILSQFMVVFRIGSIEENASRIATGGARNIRVTSQAKERPQEETADGLKAVGADNGNDTPTVLGPTGLPQELSLDAAATTFDPVPVQTSSVKE